MPPLLTQYGSNQRNTSTGRQSLWDVGLEAFLGAFAPEDEEEEIEEPEEFEEEEYEDEEFEEGPGEVYARASRSPLLALAGAALPALLPSLTAGLAPTAAAAVAPVALVAKAAPVALAAPVAATPAGGLLGLLLPVAAVAGVIFGGGFSLTRGSQVLFGRGGVGPSPLTAAGMEREFER